MASLINVNRDILMFESDAWHRLGTVFGRLLQMNDITDVTIPQVEVRPIYTRNNDGVLIEIEERRALVDTTCENGLVVGVASPTYGVIQFDRMLEAIQAFFDTGMIEGISSFLTIDNRRRIAVSLKLKGELEFKGYTVMKPLINMSTTHDGSSGFVGANALENIVCANTHLTNLLGLPKMFSVRHTRNGDQYAVDAIREVEQAMALQVEINTVVERLINEPFTERDFAKLVDDCFQYGSGAKRPIPNITDEGRSRTIYDNFTAGMTVRYYGDDIAPIQKTKFGALMAIQGWEQHLSTGTKDRQARHLDRLYFGKLPVSEYAASRLLTKELVSA